MLAGRYDAAIVASEHCRATARDDYQRSTQAHTLLATSSAAAELKRDDALGPRYDEARVALAAGDLTAARAAAVAYASSAAERRNDARVRQAHELNGLLALAAQDFDESLAELDRADQQNPAVWFAKARAYTGRGDSARAKAMDDRARHMNILPTFPYVFTRARLAAATRSATSESAVERRR